MTDSDMSESSSIVDIVTVEVTQTLTKCLSRSTYACGGTIKVCLPVVDTLSPKASGTIIDTKKQEAGKLHGQVVVD
jgi:hypothetical protein